MEFINPRFTGSVGLLGTFEVEGSITSSMLGTASYALQSLAAFPYTGSALITGTLYVTDEISLGGFATSSVTASQVISSSAEHTRLSGSFSGSFYGTFVGVDTTLISSASATASIKFDISGSSSLQINTDTLITGSLVLTGSLTVGSNLNTGIESVAFGNGTTAAGDYSYAQGEGSEASGIASHAEGYFTSASGNYSHAQGQYTTASGIISHAEGSLSQASGIGSHAEGAATLASGNGSHAEGQYTTASGNFSHAEGATTYALGFYSHTEGQETVASGAYAHAEGHLTTASGDYSHAEGFQTTAFSTYAHAEGFETIASGAYSHAEGLGTVAEALGSHAEGRETVTSGSYSHAEGRETIALGNYSHAEGFGTIASGSYQHAQGRYNVTASSALWILGDGASDTDRKNLITAYTSSVHVSGAFNVSGAIHIWQSASVSGTNIYGTSSHADTASYLDGFVGQGITLSFLTASTTWSVAHGLNTTFPIIHIWDSSSFEVIQPDVIESKNLNTTEIRFTTPRTGYANVAIAGAPLYQKSPFYTASFALTASFISGAVNVQDSISASWAATASYVFGAGNSVSASFASSSLTASVAYSVTTISGSAPSGPTVQVGSLWYDDTTLALYVRYQDPSGSQWWIPASNGVLSNALSSSYSTISERSNGFTASFLSQSTVIVNHNLGTKALVVSVYDDLDYQVIPSSVQLSDNNNAVIQFFSVESGYVVIK